MKLPVVNNNALANPVEWGSGVESVVVKAEWTGRQVAVKKMRLAKKDAHEKAYGRACIVREALALQMLTKSDAVPKCLGMMRGGGGLILELLPGVTIESMWQNLPGVAPEDDDHQELGKPMAAPIVMKLLKQVGQALEHAHELKILHRDIHPGNIMWCEAKLQAHVIDWETASGPPALAVHKRFKERIIGVGEYNAPEFKSNNSTAACDVWGYATISRELLCGKRPFTDALPPQPTMDTAFGRMLQQCTDTALPAATRPTMADLMRVLAETKTV